MHRLKKIHLNAIQQYNEEREKQEQNKSQIQLKQFNHAAIPYQDFNNIDFDEIFSIKLSESGARGVIFIESNKGAIVLKLSGQVGLEQFLNKLQIDLKITTPKMKCLKWCDKEMNDLKEKILYAASNDDVLFYRLKQKLKTAFFEMIEYIPGIPLELLYGQRAQLIFTQERLENLGKILAFDIFINNGDRFPLPIWRSVGNAYNVILKINHCSAEQMHDINQLNLEFDQFYAIDPSTIIKIKENNNQNEILNSYMQKVEAFLINIKQELQQNNSNSLKSLQNFIFDHTNYKLTNQDLLYITKGLIEQVNIISQYDIERVKQILQDTLIPDDQDWMQTYNSNLLSLHIEFYEQMIALFKRHQ